MISVFRKFWVIAGIFGIMLFIQSLNLESLSGIANPKSLAALGFVILTSFTLGEIFSLIKLPKVLGYIFAGILFGPFFGELIQNKIFTIFSLDVVYDLSLVNQVTFSLIALYAGMELKLEELKNSIKSISFIIIFQIVFVYLIITAATFFVSPYIPFLANQNSAVILAAGALIATICLGTSVELTFAIKKEISPDSKLGKLVLNTAILKDILVILLFAMVIAISNSIFSDSPTSNYNVFAELGIEFFFSFLAGVLIGILALVYIKYIHREMLVFILALVIIGSGIINIFHLETLITFVTAGFLISNFSENSNNFFTPLEKLALPIFVVFFTVTGASINLSLVFASIVIGISIFILRAIAIYLATKSASKFVKESLTVQKYSWLGFLPLGGLILGLSFLIAQRVPEIGNDLQTIIFSVVVLNLIFGTFLYKIGLIKEKNFVHEIEKEKQPVKIIDDPDKNVSVDFVKPKKAEPIKKKERSKFNEPNFDDQDLTKSLFNLLFQINKVLMNFEKTIIYQRSEESLELIIGVTEKYSEEYHRLKQAITTPKITADDIRSEILETKRNLAVWYNQLAEERKNIEKKILDIEPQIKELFVSLSDITDGLSQIYEVDLEPAWFNSDDDDSFTVRLRKFMIRTKFKLFKIFKDDYKLTRIIFYRNFAKYFLVGRSSEELLEVVNLVGNERLITLRKIKAIYDDMGKYFEELLQAVNEEEDSIALTTILLEKFDEIHSQLVNEINIHTNEINRTSNEISERLHFALANPYNEFLEILRIAGTFELNENRYRFSKIFDDTEENHELAFEGIRYWYNYYLGFLGDWQKDSNITKINVDVFKIIQTNLVGTANLINNLLTNVSTNLNVSLIRFKNSIDAAYKEKDVNKLAELINFAKENLTSQLLKKNIDEFSKVRKSKKLNKMIELFIKDFQKLSENLPAEILILENEDLVIQKRMPKLLPLKSLKFREIVKPILEINLPRELSEVNELLLNHINFTTLELKNIFSIVNYHINTAEKELSEEEELGLKVVYDLFIELVEKIRNRSESLSNQIAKVNTSIDQIITEKVSGITNEIEEALRIAYRQSIFEHTQKLLPKFSMQIQNYFTGVSNFFRRILISIKRGYNKNIKGVYKDIINDFEISDSFNENNFPINDFELDEKKLSKLPFIYRKLFDGTPLETTDLYVSRDEIFNIIKKAVDDFQINKPSATVLIGEPGSGKSSIINTISTKLLVNYEYIRYYFSETIYSSEDLHEILSSLLGFNRSLTTDELIINLNDRISKRVIILEDVHKLFLKKVGGFSALNFLIDIISLTNQNTLWICTINKHAWNLLDSNFNLSILFNYKINTETLNLLDIESIILNRHSVTGFEIEFIPSRYYKFRSSIFRKRDKIKQQKEIEDIYFRKLIEYSEGNILSAMYYWLKSIRSVEGNTIIMNPVRRINLSVLNNLDIKSALTLANILQHEWLTTEEHSQVFNLNIEESREILMNLTNLSLITRDQAEIDSTKFYINKFLYKQIEKELIKRNIL